MKIFIYLFFIIYFFFVSPVNAIYDPRSLPNNKIGIHILFTDEIFQANDLINSKDGDWGYVTIPIQSADKNITKWQTFMDDCKELHIIPILRLATNGDYFNTRVWEKPKPEDVLDFANFLNSLDWPTKNRYVIIYNEVNRGDEWGGNVSPSEYAEILNFAADTFKSKNQDFFVISAGLDNAAPNSMPNYMNEYDFLRAMEQTHPEVFSKIDGISSHSYPNPGFSQPPYVNTTKSVYSFGYEKELVDSMAGKDLPVFITETGWSSKSVNNSQISNYFREAYNGAWSNKDVIAVTPFLLRAGGEPFGQFSFIKENGEKDENYKVIESMNKTKGEPAINSVTKKKIPIQQVLPIRRFLYDIETKNDFLRSIQPTKKIFKWLLSF